MANNRVCVIINLYCTAGKEDEFQAFLINAMQETKQYKGNLSVEVRQSATEPSFFRIMSEWASEEERLIYMAWRQESGFIDQLASFLTTEPEFIVKEMELVFN